MKKILYTVALCFILTQIFSQSQKNISTYVLMQYNKTLYDRTIGNNPSAVGLALQAFYNNKSKFKPTIELTGDIYLEDDKLLRLDNDGTISTKPNDVRSMVNIFAGSSYHPTQYMYVSLAAGPSFISGQTLFGIKPSFGFYFSKNQKWTGKVSYINIFKRGYTTKQNFGSLSLAIGLKLF